MFLEGDNIFLFSMLRMYFHFSLQHHSSFFSAFSFIFLSHFVLETYLSLTIVITQLPLQTYFSVNK